MAGVLATVALLVTLLGYAAFRLTTFEPAAATFSAVATEVFLRSGDLSDEFALVQTAARLRPGDTFDVPGLNLTVRGDEIADLSQREAVRLVMGRLALTLYYEGTDAAEALIEDSAAPLAQPPGAPLPDAVADERFDLELGPFVVLTDDAHDRLKVAWVLPAMAAAALSLLVVLLSRRSGRLGSPGMCLAVAAAPLAIASQVALGLLPSPDGEPSLRSDLALALEPAVRDLADLYLRLAIVGAALVVLAVVAPLALRLSIALVSRLRRWRAAREAVS